MPLAAPSVQPKSFALSRFSMRDMIECGKALRNACASRSSFAEASQAVVDYLHERLVDEAGAPAAALTRLFKTHSYGDLPLGLQSIAKRAIADVPVPDPSMKCLVLAATRGTEHAWNDRYFGRGDGGPRSQPHASGT